MAGKVWGGDMAGRGAAMTIDWASCARREARFFSWDEVRAAFEAMDPNLGTAPVDFAKELFLGQASACPECGRAPEALRWASIGTSDDIWASGDERCGWITLCERCSLQVSFIPDEEMTQLRREGNR